MSRHLRNHWLAVALAVLAIVAQLSLLAVRNTASVVSGDEGTFLAMTASLALDGDLTFTDEDRQRLEGYPKGGRQAVILQKTESGISYSKPSLFPLLAAPWFRFFGDVGPVLLNGVSLLFAVVIAWAFMRRRVEGAAEEVGPWMVTFLGTGVLLSYVAWTMSDSLQASLVVAGIALSVGVRRIPGAPDTLDRLLASYWSATLGGILLGLATSMRYPNLLLALAPAVALTLQGRRLRGAVSALAVAAALLAGLSLNQILNGAPVPYKTVRATFNAETGYPAGEGGEGRLAHFEEARATHRLGVIPTLRPRVSLYSSLYFFVGRHTGLLIFSPVVLVFSWLALRHRDAVSWVLIGAAAALAVFYLLWMPRNYFGGATFLGNRYFLTAQAALLLAPRRLPGRRTLATLWTLAAVVFLSAFYSSIRTREIDGTSQMHTHAGIFRFFPYETTASDLDGRRDRYWSDELVRFVDPFAKVGEQGFKLATGTPAAELVTASGRDHGVIRLLVQADVPEIEIVYRDWLEKKRFRFTAEDGGGARGFLEVVPSPTMRRHQYWWDEKSLLSVRSIRLQLRTPDGGAAKAEVRYAGPYRFVPRFYRGEVETLRIPSQGAPGTGRRVPISIRNTGSRYWATDDPIPIFLSYRLRKLPGKDDDAPATGPLSRLPHRIAPGEVAQTRLELVLPREAGEYEVAIDLVVAGLNWFEEWNSRPLARRRIRVLEPGQGNG